LKATEVTAGPAESNGSLLPGLWRDSLHVTCGLTACTSGSAPGPVWENFTFLQWLHFTGVVDKVVGPTVWNSLPDNVVSAPSLSTFRQSLKTFLLSAASLASSLITMDPEVVTWSWTSLKLMID